MAVIAASELRTFLASRNVQVMAVGTSKIRMMTHLDVDDVAVESLLNRIGAYLDS